MSVSTREILGDTFNQNKSSPPRTGYFENIQLNNSMKLNDIEIEFNSHLARVYDRGSMNSGVQGCHKMVNEFAGN